MFGMTTAVRIYADTHKEPETVLLGGTTTERVTEIQNAVGGHFDAVRRQAVDESGNHKPFVLIGYVHDEGRILNLPMNPIASVLFEQNLFGDVLIVNGTNPETGEYDGETHDLPMAFCEYIIKAMYPAIQESIVFSKMLALAVSTAKQDGTITEAEFQKLRSFMVDKYNDPNERPAASLDELPNDLREILGRCVKNMIVRIDEVEDSALKDILGTVKDEAEGDNE